MNKKARRGGGGLSKKKGEKGEKTRRKEDKGGEEEGLNGTLLTKRYVLCREQKKGVWEARKEAAS